jgi:hypothetical protein
MKIPTLDTEGRPNGYLQPIWNALDSPHLRPDQVYATAVAPHSRKGPHLHNVRRGLFVCLTGQVTLVKRWNEIGVVTRILTPEKGYSIVPPGVPCALVLNMPSPAWSRKDPDDHPVTDWVDPADWPPKSAERLEREKYERLSKLVFVGASGIPGELPHEEDDEE